MEATPVEPVDTPAAVESEAAAATPVLDARSAYIAQLRKEAAGACSCCAVFLYTLCSPLTPHPRSSLPSHP